MDKLKTWEVTLRVGRYRFHMIRLDKLSSSVTFDQLKSVYMDAVTTHVRANAEGKHMLVVSDLVTFTTRLAQWYTSRGWGTPALEGQPMARDPSEHVNLLDYVVTCSYESIPPHVPAKMEEAKEATAASTLGPMPPVVFVTPTKRVTIHSNQAYVELFQNRWCFFRHMLVAIDLKALPDGDVVIHTNQFTVDQLRAMVVYLEDSLCTRQRSNGLFIDATHTPPHERKIPTTDQIEDAKNDICNAWMAVQPELLHTPTVDTCIWEYAAPWPIPVVQGEFEFTPSCPEPPPEKRIASEAPLLLKKRKRPKPIPALPTTLIKTH